METPKTNQENGETNSGKLFPDLQAGGNDTIPINLGTSIASEHKRKRGRPPGKGNKPANDLKKETESSVTSPSIEPVTPAIDPEIIQESVKSILTIVDSTMKENVESSAFEICNNASLAKGLADKVAMKDLEKDMISKLSGQVCVQYNVAGQHAPAAFLAVFAVGYTTRVLHVLKKLKTLEAFAREERAKNANSKPSL